ncbi:MAG: N-acetylmuramoyl-L-alanine amidase [Anaerolineaceae bacterium]|nr:N-acetylmuramoyl-L-alanine amidase [Anaerolineaceae bacterium]
MDDDFFQPDDSQAHDTPDESEVAASVTFMEIMRQAAAKAEPPPVRKAASPLTTPPVMPAPESPALSPEEIQQRREAALEAHRIQRVRRRRGRRRRQTASLLGGIVRSFLVVIIAAGLVATIFTWWTPSQFLAEDVKAELSVAIATSQATPLPTVLPTPNWLRRVGIVSGHRGPEIPPDPGAVCPDGLTEAELNFSVAQKVVLRLRQRGYSVDLLDEFDPRLEGYQAAALVSIHANTCQDFGELVSGFLVAAAQSRLSARGNDEVLVDCLARFYQQYSGLERRDGLTVDMTDYHTFREINQLTPAAILELGFLLADRNVLTQQQDALADGITQGILCFLEPSSVPISASPFPPTPTITPVPAG